MDEFRHLGSPLTLPAGAKWPPPAGTTGRDPEHAMEWAAVGKHLRKGGNWGLRVGPEFVVVDVDAHRGEAQKVEALRIMEFHNFAPTLQVSRRFAGDSVSGHYWYRIPEAHDWETQSFISNIRTREVHWGETVHRNHRYAVMPGSVVDGAEYEARWHGGEGVIAELPRSFYAEILRRIYAEALPKGKGGRWSKAQIASMREQQRQSLAVFKLAREGSRDDKAMRAARDIGALWRMTGDDAGKDRGLGKLREAAARNDADSATVAKFEDQIRTGYERPTLLGDMDADEDRDWWHSRPALERTFNRAMLNRDSPWATLLTELVFLSAATDHRVLLQPPTADPPRPCALWLGVVAESGRHKSRVFARTRPWAEVLPDTDMPTMLRAAREGEADHGAYPRLLRQEAMKPRPRIYTPQTGPGVAAEFMRTHKFGGKPQEVKAFYRALAYYDEPDDIFRRTNTEHRLTTVLRSTFYSELINPGTAKKEGRYVLHEGSYVLSLIVNIQPYIMAKFRGLSDNGTFQRLIFTDTEIDVDLAETMCEAPEAYPSERSEIARWLRGKVTLSAEAKAELSEMEWWHMGLDRAHEREWWENMARRGTHEAGHLDVKLQRLAVMLYRHDGGELEDGVTEIPDLYFRDAKRIMKHSASVVRNTVNADIAKAEAETRKELRRETRLAEARREGELKADDASVVARYADRYERFGGSDGAWQAWRKTKHGKTHEKQRCLELWLEAGGEK